MDNTTTPQVVQFFLIQSVAAGYIALKKEELRKYHQTVAIVGSHNGSLLPVKQYTKRRYGTDRVSRPNEVDHAQ